MFEDYLKRQGWQQTFDEEAGGIWTDNEGEKNES